MGEVRDWPEAAIRAIAALAMVGAPPVCTVFAAVGLRGVAVPVAGVPEPLPDSSSEGRVGSGGISP